MSIPESQINLITNNSIVKNNHEEQWQGVDGLISDDEDFCEEEKKYEVSEIDLEDIEAEVAKIQNEYEAQEIDEVVNEAEVTKIQNEYETEEIDLDDIEAEVAKIEDE